MEGDDMRWQTMHKSCGLLSLFCSHWMSGEIVRVGAQWDCWTCSTHKRNKKCIHFSSEKTPEGEGSLGRRGHRWRDNIKSGLKKLTLQVADWFQLVEHGVHWRTVVDNMSFRVSCTTKHFLNSSAKTLRSEAGYLTYYSTPFNRMHKQVCSASPTFLYGMRRYNITFTYIMPLRSQPSD